METIIEIEHESLQPLHDMFLDEANKRNFMLPPIHLVLKIEGTKVGHTKYEKGKMVVRFNPFFPYKSEIMKEIIFLHEMGHAYLGRDHDSIWLMRATVYYSDSLIYQENRSMYIDQLFKSHNQGSSSVM